MFSDLSLDSCTGNSKGEKEWWRKVALHPGTYPKSQGGACAFLFHFWFLGGVVCCTKLVLPILVTGLTGFGGTGLTDIGNWPDRFVPRVGTCSGGACICTGGLVYALVVCALCLSIVLSRMCQAVALA
jgi:hypothetical protein